MKKLLIAPILAFMLGGCADENLYDESIIVIAQPAVPSMPIVYNLTGTMYNAVKEQCDADPLITAGMYKINYIKASEHKWIALSRDLLKRWGGPFWYGDIVIISNAGHKDGTYKIVDTMNKRFKNRIDFLETMGTARYKLYNITMETLRHNQ